MINNYKIKLQEISSLQLALQVVQSKMNEMVSNASIIEESKEDEIPEVYISGKETCRILNISNPTLNSLIEIGLIDILPSKINERDKFLLIDIMWLRNQPFRGARDKLLKEILIRKANYLKTK